MLPYPVYPWTSSSTHRSVYVEWHHPPDLANRINPGGCQHSLKTEVTYIIVGSMHNFQSILLWDYQLQFVSVLSSSITLPIQNPFLQTQLSPLPQILFQILRHLITHFHCIKHLAFHPGNYLINSGIHLLGLNPVGSSHLGGGILQNLGSDGLLMASIDFPLEHQGLLKWPWRWPQQLLPWYSDPIGS